VLHRSEVPPKPGVDVDVDEREIPELLLGVPRSAGIILIFLQGCRVAGIIKPWWVLCLRGTSSPCLIGSVPDRDATTT
jgi:hypothetical protein